MSTPDMFMVDDDEMLIDDDEMPIDDRPAPMTSAGRLAAHIELTPEQIAADFANSLDPIEKEEPAQAVATAAPETALATIADILPADFPLPALIRFAPNLALKTAVETSAKYALSLEVRGQEGLQLADVALTTLNDDLKAIREHFAEPAETANALHKRITGTRAEWMEAGVTAKETLGRRVWVEQQRLKVLEDEQRRKDQEDANRKAREDAARAAEEAAKQQAPARVVEQLREDAKTVQAAPVPTQAATATALKGNSVVTKWKSRIKGTPADDEPNPDITDLTPAQWENVKALLLAIVAGTQPRACISLDWSYLNKRAVAEEQALGIVGIESYKDGGVRSKASRKRP